MTREDFLRYVAETAYNIGYGAKKHFATYDIVEKAPGIIGFSSMAIGVFSLFIEQLAEKGLSAALIVLGIAALHVGHYEHNKTSYDTAGAELTELFNRLKKIYFSAKSAEPFNSDAYEKELREIEAEFSKVGISKQILLSDWYAHYKFFWQHQAGWIDDQLGFRFFRDKIPLSLTAVIATLLIAASVLYVLTGGFFC